MNSFYGCRASADDGVCNAVLKDFNTGKQLELSVDDTQILRSVFNESKWYKGLVPEHTQKYDLFLDNVRYAFESLEYESNDAEIDIRYESVYGTKDGSIIPVGNETVEKYMQMIDILKDYVSD